MVLCTVMEQHEVSFALKHFSLRNVIKSLSIQKSVTDAYHAVKDLKNDAQTAIALKLVN